MTTAEVAKKLVEYCRSGEWDTATNTLYADNIVSIEPESSDSPTRVEGLAGKKQKDEMFSQMVEQFLSSDTSEPLVAGNYFTITMKMVAIFKGMGEVTMEEVCVYRVNENGKIDYEEFFY